MISWQFNTDVGYQSFGFVNNNYERMEIRVLEWKNVLR